MNRTIAHGTLVLIVFIAAITIFTADAHAQSPYLPTGSWTNPVLAPNCNNLSGFDTNMICYTTTVRCPDPSNPGHNLDDLSLTFGYENAQGPYKGTIVMFTGAGGTAPATLGTEISFIQHYNSNGYEIVQLAWDDDWENTYFPVPPDWFGNVQFAACRQATFLNFVHSSTHVTPQTPAILYQTGKGMCAQGSSAGSAAIAYAMAWYGAADSTTGFLDNVELLAGPPLSRIDLGCQEPAAPNVAVCGSGGISACKGWPSSGTSLSPTYISPAYNGVRQWTNVAACAAPGANTSPWNAVWDDMSIVNPFISSQQLNYPKTSVGAWLCDTTTGAAMNNTTPEGYLFYQQITPKANFFTVNAIYLCAGAEGVASGKDINNKPGLDAVEDDMINSCNYNH